MANGVKKWRRKIYAILVKIFQKNETRFLFFEPNTMNKTYTWVEVSK